MADIVCSQVRSQMMAGIRGKNTKPELLVRSGLHKLGFRFRIHVRTLPGRPDIVLPKWNAVIFVHGCFWHRHDCHLFRLPSTRRSWWRRKLDRNYLLDLRSRRQLKALNWRVLSIYECALKGKERIPLDTVIQFASHWLRSNARMAQIRGTRKQKR